MTEIILTEVKNGIGFITLNSPRNLNSINLEMANALILTLEKWMYDKNVHCVFLQGNEKSFCAGGDLKSLYKTFASNLFGVVSKEALDFFVKEYTLDYLIHTYNKPIVAWGNGIVMGGGIGLLVGASHRIMTENSLLAMPEITIGLYPDVGGTWFLNKMPDGWGNYFGLTGARMTGGDALYLGIADYFITSDLKESVIKNLMLLKWSQTPEVNKKNLDIFFKTITINNSNSPVQERNDFSKKLSKIDSFFEFRALLEEQALQDEWIQLGLLSLRAGSPTSALVIYEQLKRGKNLNLKQVFCSELNLTVHFSTRPDFPEGIRALLIDKDQKPNWKPQAVEEISREYVESFFTPIWSPSEPPLDTFICSQNSYFENS